MFFNSINEISRLRKELNRSSGKGISNIYLKVTIEEKNWPSQNVNFLGLKIYHWVNLGELQLTKI